MNTDRRPLAVYHEHPDWFRPLFAELDRRGLPYVRLDPRAHSYNPGWPAREHTLIVNGLSAFTIETSKARQATLLESLDLPYPKTVVVNHVSQVVGAAKGLR